MKITYRQLLSSSAAFKELQALKLPPRTTLDVYKLGKALDKEIEAYQDLSKKLYERHEVPQTEQGYDLQALDKDQLDLIIKDLDEVLDVDFEVKAKPISVNIFERFDIPISTNMLIALDWLFDLNDAPKEEPTE